MFGDRIVPEHDHDPGARVVQWPAPPGCDGAGIYGVRLRDLPAADLPAVEQAARRIGLWVKRLDSDLLVQGPAALFAALPRSGMSAASAGRSAGRCAGFGWGGARSGPDPACSICAGR